MYKLNFYHFSRSFMILCFRDTVRKLEKRYSNLTIISGINNLDSYLMRKVRSQDVLQIFVLAGKY